MKFTPADITVAPHLWQTYLAAGHAGRGGVVLDDDESGTKLTALQV